MDVVLAMSLPGLVAIEDFFAGWQVNLFEKMDSRFDPPTAVVSL